MAVRTLAVAQAAELGGAERALLRTLPHLSEHGVAVELAVPAEGGLGDAARAAGVAVHHLPVGSLRAGGWPRAALAWPRARGLVKRVDADVVWLNGIVPQRLVPALGPTPALLHLHDLVERAPHAWRSRRFWARVPVVACASGAVAAAAAAAGAPHGRLNTVAVPVEAVEPAPRPGWAADGGAVVGYVGRIEPRKGVLDLLAAMADLPDVRLVIVRGPDLDPDADYERRFATDVDALGDRAVVIGPVPDARALMPWFDVLCAPSLSEPFGTVAAEALAAGTPAVVTASGGMPEYVVPGRNGAVVAPGDPEALAAALRETIAAADDMAEACREDAARFAPPRAAAQLAALLQRAAGVGQTGPR